MRKCVSLSDNDVQMLNTIKEEHGFRSDSHVISWLLHNSIEKKESFGIQIRKELDKNYIPSTRILCATKVAEQNSTVILDQLNTLLHVFGIKDCIPVDENPHPSVLKSQRILKKKIILNKQKKDYR